jgi:hypothetical protein
MHLNSQPVGWEDTGGSSEAKESLAARPGAKMEPPGSQRIICADLDTRMGASFQHGPGDHDIGFCNSITNVRRAIK